MAIVHDEHNYASNGKANAALTTGIIGTSGFGLALLNGLGGLFNGGPKPACSEEHVVNRYEAAQSARIAELETEVKFRDANIYTDQKMLELYKYFDGNLMAGVDVLKNQVSDTRAILAGITRTAVPSNVICNMCCNSCNGSNF